MTPANKPRKTASSPKPTQKSSNTEAQPSTRALERTQRMTVVGIGASAGGLAALISFEEMEEKIRITVSDGGNGFDLGEKAKKDLPKEGIMRFQNRLALMGCKLDIQSMPGDGTTVVIDIPHSQVRA